MIDKALEKFWDHVGFVLIWILAITIGAYVYGKSIFDRYPDRPKE